MSAHCLDVGHKITVIKQGIIGLSEMGMKTIMPTVSEASVHIVKSLI